MTENRKIENAAIYWYTCTLEGFPKGQEEVFYEWIKSDLKHRIAYENISQDQCNDSGNLKKGLLKNINITFNPYFIFCVLLMFCFLLIIKLL